MEGSRPPRPQTPSGPPPRTKTGPTPTTAPRLWDSPSRPPRRPGSAQHVDAEAWTVHRTWQRHWDEGRGCHPTARAEQGCVCACTRVRECRVHTRTKKHGPRGTWYLLHALYAFSCASTKFSASPKLNMVASTPSTCTFFRGRMAASWMLLARRCSHPNTQRRQSISGNANRSWLQTGGGGQLLLELEQSSSCNTGFSGALSSQRQEPRQAHAPLRELFAVGWQGCSARMLYEKAGGVQQDVWGGGGVGWGGVGWGGVGWGGGEAMGHGCAGYGVRRHTLESAGRRKHTAGDERQGQGGGGCRLWAHLCSPRPQHLY